MGMKATQCLSCMASLPEMEYSRPLWLGCSLAFHNILLNEMKKVGCAATLCQTCVCVSVRVFELSVRLKTWTSPLKRNELKKGDPSLLMLQHDLAQVSPLAWRKGHFEERKSNTGIWAGPLSHRGY